MSLEFWMTNDWRSRIADPCARGILLRVVVEEVALPLSVWARGAAQYEARYEEGPACAVSYLNV